MSLRKDFPLAAIAACLLAPTAAHAQEDSHIGMVLVQRTVNARYTADAQRFQEVLGTTLTRNYTVQPGDSFQKIVSDNFAVGPTSAKNVYEGISSKIEALNDLDKKKLQAGRQILLPDIPPMQWKQASPDNPNYGIPRIQFAQTLADKASGVATAKLSDLGRRAEDFVTTFVWMTPAQAKAERDLKPSSPASVDYYWTQPITVKFAQAQAQAQPGPAKEDAKFIGSLVKRKVPPQDVVVFVLDDSWPSAASFESSRAFLVKALDDIAAANHFPAPSWPADVRNGTAKTNFPLQRPPRHSHAALIEAALAPFQSLTPKVHVVYLPLFTEQTWAKEIWQELASTAVLAKAMHNSLGTVKPLPDLVAESRKTAADLVKVVPTKAVDDIGSAQQAPLTVLGRIAELYTSTTGTPYFISMSWTVEDRTFDFGPDADAMGLFLAAAGNDGKDVVSDDVYMAFRAKSFPGDVLAVMNTDGVGDIHCGSNKLPLTVNDPFYGLAYDGTIDGPNPVCATSFSTPRVAWLLALRQAYYGPVTADSDRKNWFSTYRKGLLGLQTTTQNSSRRYLLSVPRLFDGL